MSNPLEAPLAVTSSFADLATATTYIQHLRERDVETVWTAFPEELAPNDFDPIRATASVLETMRWLLERKSQAFRPENAADILGERRRDLIGEAAGLLIVKSSHSPAEPLVSESMESLALATLFDRPVVFSNGYPTPNQSPFFSETTWRDLGARALPHSQQEKLAPTSSIIVPKVNQLITFFEQFGDGSG